MRPVVLAAAFALAAAGAQAGVWAWGQGRRHVPATSFVPNDFLPTTFGRWRQVPTAVVPVDPFNSGSDEAAAEAYDAVVSRTYRRTDGVEVLLTLAYGRRQEQESKIHRPELCYFAQGYAVSRLATALVDDRRVASFIAISPERAEMVAYWIRVGDTISTSPWATRAALLRMATHHVVPDGILVRASIVSATAPDNAQLSIDWAILSSFLSRLADGLPPERRWLLTGGSAALAAAR